MEAKTEKKIRELLDVAKAHSLAEMSFQENGLRVAFRRNPKHLKPAPRASAPAAKPSESAAAPVVEGDLIRSPIVGTFRRSTSKDHPPMVVEGNHVKPGDRLGIVECMKIPNEVVSYAEGPILKIFVEDGQAVEYGQPLFSVMSKASDSSKANGSK